MHTGNIKYAYYDPVLLVCLTNICYLLGCVNRLRVFISTIDGPRPISVVALKCRTSQRTANALVHALPRFGKRTVDWSSDFMYYRRIIYLTIIIIFNRLKIRRNFLEPNWLSSPDV